MPGQPGVIARRRVLFIASREPAYSRVDITMEALSRHFDVIPLVSSAPTYRARITHIVRRLVFNRFDYDAVFLGFFAQPLFPIVRLLCRKPIVSDMYFSLYDTFINDKGLASHRHPLAKLCLWLDRHTALKSRLLLSDTDGNASYIADLTGIPTAKIKRLWISAQPAVFKRLPELPPPDPGDNFRVLFYGGFIPLQGVDTIIRAASLLRGERVHFDIVGRGQTLSECVQLDRELGNTNTTFHGWLSQQEVLSLAKASHLVLGIFGASGKASRVIPNKVFEGLAMGKPVLTGDSPALRELLTPGTDVLASPMHDAAGLASAIRHAIAHYDAVLSLGSRGYETFRDRASPDAVAEILRTNLLAALGLPETKPLERTSTSD